MSNIRRAAGRMANMVQAKSYDHSANSIQDPTGRRQVGQRRPKNSFIRDERYQLGSMPFSARITAGSGTNYQRA